MRKRLILSLLLTSIALGALLARQLLQAPAATTAAIAPTQAACRTLPTLQGSDLDGVPRIYPDDFTGALNFVVMPFTREQQERALAWVAPFQALTRDNGAWAYYNLAALPDLSAPIRLLVVGGMSLAVSAPDVRAVTVVAFLENQADFLSALDIADTSEMVVLVVDTARCVVYQASGDYTPEGEQALRAWLATR